MPRDFSDLQIRVRAHTLWTNRAEFVSTTSRFADWVCVAPESGGFRYEIAVEKDSETQIERGQAQNGDLVFAAPRALFDRTVCTPPLSYHVLQWSFWDGPERIESVWQAGKVAVRDAARLKSTLAALRVLPSRRDAYAARLSAHLLEDLLHLSLDSELEGDGALPISDGLMREAARLLRDRAGEMLAMSEVSRALNLSSVQLTRRFRAAHGCNPIEYLTRIRLENAQKMLVETPATLDEIARNCGWASGSYLSHVFERHLQTTPGCYRALHRV